MTLFPVSHETCRQLRLVFVLVFVGLTLHPSNTEAQSGRRAAKSPTPANGVPPPVPTVAPETEKELLAGQLASPVHLLVARQPTSKHLTTEDQIFASFVKHLNQYDNIEATSIGDTREGQAVERARAETERFVILMKFEIDSFQSGTIIMNSQDLQVEYAVFAPRTGKRQTKGKVFFQGIGGGRLRKSEWPRGTPIRITPEAAGIEAADGLYFWLKLVALQNRER
jgi:hypothetical protein